MASLSTDITNSIMKLFRNDFKEIIQDTVARSVSRRVLDSKKYTIKDTQTDETYKNGVSSKDTAKEGDKVGGETIVKVGNTSDNNSNDGW